MRSSIVCGIDGSKESVFAAKVAASLAGALERKLVLAHAMQDPPTFPYDDTWSREVQRKRASEEGTWLLERVAAELPGEEPELRVLFGDPIESLGIVGGDDDVELLVLGTRGRSRLAGALLRSVSAHLGSAARCPVIVVPPGAHERFLQPDRSGSSIVCGIDGSAEAARAERRGGVGRGAGPAAAAGRRRRRPPVSGPGRRRVHAERRPIPRSGRGAARACAAQRRAIDRRRLARAQRAARGTFRIGLGRARRDRAAAGARRAPDGAIAGFTTAASGHDRAAAA